LPSADPRAAAILRTLTAFEESVAAADVALAERNWAGVEALLDAQHRLTHALANALDETLDVRPQSFTDEVHRRIAEIREQRADQLRRLVAFNHLVKARLSVIARAREMRRSGGQSGPAPRLLNTLQ
jgi:hypothetical protein